MDYFNYGSKITHKHGASFNSLPSGKLIVLLNLQATYPRKMGDMISSLLFQPPPVTFLHPSRYFYIVPSHGTPIPAFYIKSKTPSEVTLLFSHGNAEDIGMIYDWFADLARVLKVNVMSYDYKGYGPTSPENGKTKASGKQTIKPVEAAAPSEVAVYQDITAAYDYLLNVKGCTPNNVVLYGRSLGSGPSCYLAEKTAREGKSVAGLMLQSPLLSAYRVAFNFRFTFPGDKFANVDRAPSIMCPVWICHGTNDEVVPFWHGQELFVALPSKWRAKPFWVEGAGHNNIESLLRGSGAFLDHVTEFLDLYVPGRAGEAADPVPVPEVLGMVLRERGRGGEGGERLGGVGGRV